MVRPDRTWAYKDEDEMLDAVAHGRAVSDRETIKCPSQGESRWPA